jgi:hypothetical protein
LTQKAFPLIQYIFGTTAMPTAAKGDFVRRWGMAVTGNQIFDPINHKFDPIDIER